MTKTVHNTLPGSGCGRGFGDIEIRCGVVGSNIRTKVKLLKTDIAERTRNFESLLLVITYLNIFIENHKQIKEILLEKQFV